MENIVLSDIHQLVWGNDFKAIPIDIFRRWCQGFQFSAHEATALLQEEGGPCSILTAVQASILRIILFEMKLSLSNFSEHNIDPIMILSSSVIKILKTVLNPMLSPPVFCLVYLKQDPCELLKNKENISTLSENRRSSDEIDFSLIITDKSRPQFIDITKVFNYFDFFSTPSEEYLHAYCMSVTSTLQSPLGVLSFLYSVLLTRGPDTLKCDLGFDSMETSFININDGNSIQSLLNLFLTGRAIPELFDGVKEFGGINLQGVMSQPPTGFLTLMEAHRMCEVGWYLKNPNWPIWVLGSEAHWTLLFSDETGLVHSQNSDSDENATKITYHQALNMWHKLDVDARGFVNADEEWKKLTEAITGKTLSQIELDQLLGRLDKDGYQIIMENKFFEEFYPEEEKQKSIEQKKKFSLYHYNGIPLSNVDHKVVYRRGEAVILDPTHYTDGSLFDDKYLQFPVHRCLRTKWPTLLLKWDYNGMPPSLN